MLVSGRPSRKAVAGAGSGSARFNWSSRVPPTSNAVAPFQNTPTNDSEQLEAKIARLVRDLSSLGVTASTEGKQGLARLVELRSRLRAARERALQNAVKPDASARIQIFAAFQARRQTTAKRCARALTNQSQVLVCAQQRYVAPAADAATSANGFEGYAAGTTIEANDRAGGTGLQSIATANAGECGVDHTAARVLAVGVQQHHHHHHQHHHPHGHDSKRKHDDEGLDGAWFNIEHSLAAYYIKRGELADAMGLYDKLLGIQRRKRHAVHPSCTTLYLGKGRVQLQLQDFAAAEESFRSAAASSICAPSYSESSQTAIARVAGMLPCAITGINTHQWQFFVASMIGVSFAQQGARRLRDALDTLFACLLHRPTCLEPSSSVADVESSFNTDAQPRDATDATGHSSAIVSHGGDAADGACACSISFSSNSSRRFHISRYIRARPEPLPDHSGSGSGTSDDTVPPPTALIERLDEVCADMERCEMAAEDVPAPASAFEELDRAWFSRRAVGRRAAEEAAAAAAARWTRGSAVHEGAFARLGPSLIGDGAGRARLLSTEPTRVDVEPLVRIVRHRRKRGFVHAMDPAAGGGERARRRSSVGSVGSVDANGARRRSSVDLDGRRGSVGSMDAATARDGAHTARASTDGGTTTTTASTLTNAIAAPISLFSHSGDSPRQQYAQRLRRAAALAAVSSASASCGYAVHAGGQAYPSLIAMSRLRQAAVSIATPVGTGHMHAFDPHQATTTSPDGRIRINDSSVVQHPSSHACATHPAPTNDSHANPMSDNAAPHVMSMDTYNSSGGGSSQSVWIRPTFAELDTMLSQHHWAGLMRRWAKDFGGTRKERAASQELETSPAAAAVAAAGAEARGNLATEGEGAIAIEGDSTQLRSPIRESTSSQSSDDRVLDHQPQQHGASRLKPAGGPLTLSQIDFLRGVSRYKATVERRDAPPETIQAARSRSGSGEGSWGDEGVRRWGTINDDGHFTGAAYSDDLDDPATQGRALLTQFVANASRLPFLPKHVRDGTSASFARSCDGHAFDAAAALTRAVLLYDAFATFLSSPAGQRYATERQAALLLPHWSIARVRALCSTAGAVGVIGLQAVVRGACVRLAQQRAKQTAADAAAAAALADVNTAASTVAHMTELLGKKFRFAAAAAAVTSTAATPVAVSPRSQHTAAVTATPRIDGGTATEYGGGSGGGGLERTINSFVVSEPGTDSTTSQTDDGLGGGGAILPHQDIDFFAGLPVTAYGHVIPVTVDPAAGLGLIAIATAQVPLGGGGGDDCMPYINPFALRESPEAEAERKADERRAAAVERESWPQTSLRAWGAVSVQRVFRGHLARRRAASLSEPFLVPVFDFQASAWYYFNLRTHDVRWVPPPYITRGVVVRHKVLCFSCGAALASSHCVDCAEAMCDACCGASSCRRAGEEGAGGGVGGVSAHSKFDVSVDTTPVCGACLARVGIKRCTDCSDADGGGTWLCLQCWAAVHTNAADGKLSLWHDAGAEVLPGFLVAAKIKSY